MSDPVPSAAAHPESSGSHPANAEDRKAAAALSSLRPNEIGTEASPTRGPSGADQEALGKAMSRLEIAGGQKNGAHAKKVVKITAADVSFLVSFGLSLCGVTKLMCSFLGRAARFTQKQGD